MKTNFNPIGGRAAMIKCAAYLWLLAFLAVGVAAFQKPIQVIAKPVLVVVNLSTGSTGAEIQTALDSLPPAGGEVVLPAGIFEVTNPIVLQRNHQTLRGAGAATVLQLADGANCPVIILGEPVNFPRHTVSHLCVTGVFVDGNRYHQQRELWRLAGEGSEIRNNGVVVQGVSDSVVENVTCARNRSGGLVTTLGVRRLTVRNLIAFDNEFDGLACYETENSRFTQLYLHDNPGAGISLDLAFNHNVISDALLTGNDLGVFMRASRDNQFVNVSIRNSRHHGVFMAHAETQTAQGWGPAPQTECTDNSFTNLIAANCGGAAFRVNNDTCTNNIISRADFQGNGQGGLSLAQPHLLMIR